MPDICPGQGSILPLDRLGGGRPSTPPDSSPGDAPDLNVARSGESGQDVHPNRSLSTIAYTRGVFPAPDAIQGINAVRRVDIEEAVLKHLPNALAVRNRVSSLRQVPIDPG